MSEPNSNAWDRHADAYSRIAAPCTGYIPRARLCVEFVEDPDLSGADSETYVADSGQDDNYPTVDNLELLHDVKSVCICL